MTMLFISCFASLLLISSKIKDVQLLQNEKSKLSSHEESATTLLGFAQQGSFQLRNLLLVSTIDGKVNCVNHDTGELLWTTQSSWPLISSSISSFKNFKDLDDIHFIPSLDGNLYKWDGGKLENIPISADYLLDQLKRLPDGSFVTGGKEIVIYGVDINSGQICYECSTTGCQPRNNNNGNISRKNIMLLRRIQNTIRVVQHKSGDEKWHFSVGHYEIDFAERDKDAVPLKKSRYDNNISGSEFLHFVIREGLVANTNPSNLWSFKFNSPITAVWKMENDSIKPVDIFQYGLLENLQESKHNLNSLMYLGIHQGQMYIQQPTKTDPSASKEIDVVEHPHITHWRPLISTPSRTTSLNNEISTLGSLDYPYDNGFVLVSNVSKTALSFPINRDDNICDASGDDQTCQFKPDTEPPRQEDKTVPLSIKDWWKEVMSLSVFLAIIINVAYRVIKRNIAAKTDDGTMLPLLKEVEVAEEERECSVELIRKKSKGSSISVATTEQFESVLSAVEYTSRYLVDFDHLECLGKGGFGVVFKAKKKIDDCQYAIKRIYLPRCEEAKAKMMREVRALAALDHPGIVRYFHAWWEAPPSDWQIKTDKEQLLRDIGSDGASYALSHDWLLEVHSIFEDENSEEDEERSEEMAHSKIPRKKTLSDDPLGKRFNFDTGIEELISDHKEFDLLRHNDVFYADDEESFSKVPVTQNEESFDVVFEHSHSSVSMDQESENMQTRRRRTTNGTLTAFSQDDSEQNTERRESESQKKRLVGKCCTRSSSCVTDAPLFLYIQMQLCQQATLKDWLHEKIAVITLARSVDIFTQIVKAVEYFHGRGMMHRDLKPANIFFSLDGSVKVGDFGLVTAITRPAKGKHKGRSFMDENHTGQVGTQLYMSPEQATGRPYSHKVDIYSLGLILFELLCHFSTNMERMQMLYRVKHGTLPEHLQDTPQGGLVKMLMEENPDGRPEAVEIKEILLTMHHDADENLV